MSDKKLPMCQAKGFDGKELGCRMAPCDPYCISCGRKMPIPPGYTYTAFGSLIKPSGTKI